MKKHYPWLWFDVDGTLFDYNRAEATALKKTFHSLTLPFEDEYLGIYRNINSKLWRALKQQIDITLDDTDWRAVARQTR